jgi:NADH-quinone oxidoreductase subunit J
LLNLTEEELDEKVEPARKLLAGAGSVLLFALLAWAIHSSERIQAAGDTDLTGPVNDSAARAGETREIGQSLFSEHILPFEFTSILIFIAIIGAIYLTKTRSANERRTTEPAVEQPEERA